MPGSAGTQFAGSFATAPKGGGVKSPTAAPTSNGAAEATSPSMAITSAARARASAPRTETLRDEDTLTREQRVVEGRCGLAVGTAVEHVDLVQLPDRALALDHRAGQDRVEARRQRAGTADRGVGGGRTRDRERERVALDGRGLVLPGAVEAVCDLHERLHAELAAVVGQVALLAHVRE